jgi:hypothetical protein
MELFSLAIPYSFAQDRVALTWRDVQFGLKNGLLAHALPGDLATALLMADEHQSNADVIAIAGAGKHEDIGENIERLAQAERREDTDAIREKMLFLCLAWIHQHRQDYPEPLKMVEFVYEGFGHPTSIRDFVGYMPMVGPNLGSKELNMKRLYERWEAYLKAAGDSYAPRPSTASSPSPSQKAPKP